MFASLTRRTAQVATRVAVSKVSYVPVRYASFKKVGRVAQAYETQKVAVNISESKPKKDEAASKPKDVPYLNDLLRSLWMKIHPDLMHNYPEQKETNERSLMTLQGLLTGLKDASGDSQYPKIHNAVLVFYLRGSKPGHFKKAELLLHTTGSACKQVVQKQLETFFAQIGLSKTFRWDDEYFPFKSEPTRHETKEEDEQPVYRADYNETYEEFQERIMRDKK